MTTRALADLSLRPGLAFDPFGTSPRLVLEAAQAGWAVLVACNNPVTRFVLENLLQPPSEHELQAMVARLASSTKDQQRLEPFLLDLYATRCPRCSGPLSAEYFVWDRDAGQMAATGVICPHEGCRFAGEGEVSEDDRTRAQAYATRGLHRALALEQVASADDPDREHAEAALSVYPARTLYALVTLITKFQQLGLSGEAERAGRALLLSVMDAGNSLWGMPEGRVRPRQLVASQRYREVNLWRALELAVDEWRLPNPGLRLERWDARNPPAPGSVAVFAGPARSLFPELNAAPPDLVLSVPPRPNQAYWTLSALWAAWLWGRGEAAAIKVALRRRRYDWAWHQSALRSALLGLAAAIPPGTPALALVPECEPGYLAAVLAAMDADGFQLTGRALRLAEAEACLRWTAREVAAQPLPPRELPARVSRTMASLLETRGEPASFPFMHAAAAFGLAGDRLLGSVPESEEAPVTSVIYQSVERALGDRRTFTHLSTGSEPESGSYWLTQPAGQAVALSDHVETLVLARLRQDGPHSSADVDAWVCERLTGLRTPDRRWVLACLRSYATLDEAGRSWQLRAEDKAEPRAQDCAEIRRLLLDLGVRLGYFASEEDALRVGWINPDSPDRLAFSFQVCETSPPSALLASGGPLTFVIPGGRAALLAEKARRDLRLRYAVEDATRVLKFRHVRQLAQELTLRRDSLPEQLALDPLGDRDPQLPLL